MTITRRRLTAVGAAMGALLATHLARAADGLPAGKAPQAHVLWTLVFHAFGGSYFATDGTPQLDSPAGISTLQFIAKDLQPIAPSGDGTPSTPRAPAQRRRSEPLPTCNRAPLPSCAGVVC